MAPPPPSPSNPLQRVQTLSQLLDNAIAIPGTDFAVGLDPMIGLLPGGGDLVTGGLSLYILFEAFRLGASAPTLTRMATNIALDTLAGTVPVIGDLFDVAWKANARNVALLEDHVRSPTPRQQSDRLFFALLVTGLVILILGIATLSVLVIHWVVQILGAIF